MPEYSYKSSVPLRIACGVMALICLIWAQIYTGASQLKSGYILNSIQGRWLTITNIDFTSTHLWALDPLSLLVFDAERYVSQAGFGIPIFILCLWLYFSTLVRASQALSLTAIITCLLLAYYGSDPVIFPALAFFPLCLLSLRRNKAKTSFVVQAAFALLFGSMLALSANQLCLLLALMAIFWSSFTLPGERDTKFFVNSLLILTPCLLFIFIFPTSELPAYPQINRSIGLFGKLEFGQLIDREHIRYAFGRWTMISFIIAGLLLAIRKKSIRLKFTWPDKHVNTILVFFAIALLDVVAPESLAQAGPLAGFARLVPGTYTIPLIPIYLAGLVILTSATIIKYCKQQAILLWFFSLSALVFIPLRLEQNLPYVSFNKELRNRSILNSDCTVRESIKWYSTKVWREHREHLPCLKSKKLLKPKVAIPEYNVTSSRQDLPSLNKRLTDGTTRTTWKTKSGVSQLDWIQIDFSKEQEIVAIILRDSTRKNNQPRQYSVLYSNVCQREQNLSASINWQLVGSHTFQPAIDITNTGLYYLGNKDTSIWFKNPVTARCVLISPLENSEHAWKVSELELVGVK